MKTFPFFLSVISRLLRNLQVTVTQQEQLSSTTQTISLHDAPHINNKDCMTWQHPRCLALLAAHICSEPKAVCPLMNTGHRLLPTLQSPGKHDIEFSGAELHLAKSVDLFSDTQERVTSLWHISVIQLTEKRLSKVVNTVLHQIPLPPPVFPAQGYWLFLSLATQDSTSRASLGTSKVGRAGQGKITPSCWKITPKQAWMASMLIQPWWSTLPLLVFIVASHKPRFFTQALFKPYFFAQADCLSPTVELKELFFQEDGSPWPGVHCWTLTFQHPPARTRWRLCDTQNAGPLINY